MKRKSLLIAMRIFAGFMVFATILFLISPLIGSFGL